jgi:hypothetical protein
LLSKYGVTDLADTSYFTVDNALDLALVWYAQQVRAFKKSVTITPVIGTGVYSYWTIGAVTDPSIFEPKLVTCDGLPLDEMTEARLSAESPTYQSDASGAPRCWLKDDDGKVRIYPAPDAITYVLALTGYTVPATAWSGVGDSPPIALVDHDLLAVGAFMVLMCNDPRNEDAIRGNVLFPRWSEGIKSAEARIHGSGGAAVEVGRFASLPTRRRRGAETIIGA